MISVLCGDEPYKIDYYKRRALEGVSNPAVNVAYFEGEFTEEVAAACRTYPFFSEKRVVFLEIPGLSSLGKAFENYRARQPAGTDLVITCKKADKRTKALKELERAGIFKPCYKVESEEELEKLLLRECKSMNARITVSAMKEFIRRINYFCTEEMTLLGAVSYLRNAIDYSDGEVGTEAVKECVPEFKSLDIYGLAGLIKSKDIEALMGQAQLISKEGAIGAASLLLRDFRMSYKLSLGFSPSEVGSFKAPAFADAERKVLVTAISIITDEISGVKDGTVRAESLLQEIFNRLVPFL